MQTPAIQPSDFTCVLYDTRDGVARITLNRPQRRNALNRRAYDEVESAFRYANLDEAARCVVVTGADPKAAGIPSEQDVGAAYCKRTGRAGIEGFNALVAFSMFRLASIGQGVFKRNISGIGNATGYVDNSHVKELATNAIAILQRG